MEYADLLASLISSRIKTSLPTGEGLAFFGVKTKLDLHPEHGYMLSTDKFITCRDNKGNKYKITIEANPAPSMKEKLDRINKKHSANGADGDPLAYYMDSITTKLQFAMQDPTVLAEIDDAELEVLMVEVKAAREAKANRGNVINGSF